MSDSLTPVHMVRGQPTSSEQYILQECSQLRDEIWTRVKDQRITERYMLLAFAVIYSFLSIPRSDPSEEIRTLTACAWYVPPMLAALAAARWCENVQLILRIADYIQAREKQMLGQRGGWETYLKKLNNGAGPSVLLSRHYVLFWMFLIFSTMAIAVYQHALLVTPWRLSAALLAGLLAAIVTFVAITARRNTSLLPEFRAPLHHSRH